MRDDVHLVLKTGGDLLEIGSLKLEMGIKKKLLNEERVLSAKLREEKR